MLAGPGHRACVRPILNASLGSILWLVLFAPRFENAQHASTVDVSWSLQGGAAKCCVSVGVVVLVLRNRVLLPPIEQGDEVVWER